MNAIVAVLLVLNLIKLYATAQSQGIQDATPISVDLVNPSDVNVVSSDGQADEGNFGGYRPLYPPYFPREPLGRQVTSQPTPTYFDKDYYSRTSQQPPSLNFGQLSSAVPSVAPKQQQQQLQPSTFVVPPPPLPALRSQEFARGIPSYQVRTEFAKSGSLQVKSSYSFSSSSVRFPNS